MAVFILPHGYPRRTFVRLASIQLADAVNLDNPERDKTRDGQLGDLSADDHLVMMVSSKALLARSAGLKCRVSLVLAEPPAIQKRYYQILPFVSSRYDTVFTYSESLLRQVRNARYIAHGGCSIREETILKDKLGGVSMLASNKRSTTGHRLRHRVADRVKQENLAVNLIGRAYKSVACVSEALSPFSFSIVIENSRYPGYFTEKLIDCMYCRTVPIYWGDPLVARMFDARGMILCDSEDSILNTVSRLHPDQYQSMLPHVEENYIRAKRFKKHMLTRAAHDISANIVQRAHDRAC